MELVVLKVKHLQTAGGLTLVAVVVMMAGSSMVMQWCDNEVM